MPNLIFCKYFAPFIIMEYHFLNYSNSIVGYYRFGSGPKIALCFHGYGENAAMFCFFSKYACNQYTFYSIDLPFHGKTEWKEGLLTHSCLLEIVEKIIDKSKTSNLSDRQAGSKLSLLGFSLGGRIALSLYQAIPDRIEKMVLLAPDGLKVNFWYWLATQTWLGNKFFAFTMKKPGWFFGFLKLLNKLQLVNASIFKFVNYYIGDTQVRRQLYTRWTTLQKFKPNISRIKRYIRENKTPVRLIYGKHDRIILTSVGEKFKKRNEEHCTLNVIDSGHQVLQEKHIEEIMLALLH